MNHTTERFKRGSCTPVEYASSLERPQPRARLGGAYILLLALVALAVVLCKK